MSLDEWHYIGPFPNDGGQGFAATFPPEKEIDFKKKYGGRDGKPVEWKDGKFIDGKINNLALFDPPHNVNSVVYVAREIHCDKARDLSISLGSDDALAVWLTASRSIPRTSSEHVNRIRPS